MKLNFLYVGQKIQLLDNWSFTLCRLPRNKDLAVLHGIDGTYNAWNMTHNDPLCAVSIGKDSILTVYKIHISIHGNGGYDTITFTADKNEIFILSTNLPITRKQTFRVSIAAVNNLDVIKITY